MGIHEIVMSEARVRADRSGEGMPLISQNSSVRAFLLEPRR